MKRDRLNMGKHSRLDIYFDILEVIDTETNIPTRIMYKTNLYWTSLWDVLEILLKGNFIREEKKMSAKRYYITEKGRNALKISREILGRSYPKLMVS
jgi:predicted transcriptional regulator